jgi:hypothetical protein
MAWGPKDQVVKYLSDNFLVGHHAFPRTGVRVIKPSANIALRHKSSVRKFLGEIILQFDQSTLFAPSNTWCRDVCSLAWALKMISTIPTRAGGLREAIAGHPNRERADGRYRGYIVYPELRARFHDFGVTFSPSMLPSARHQRSMSEAHLVVFWRRRHETISLSIFSGRPFKLWNSSKTPLAGPHPLGFSSRSCESCVRDYQWKAL